MKNILFLFGNISGRGGMERIGVGLVNALEDEKLYNIYTLSLFGKNRPYFDLHNNIPCYTILNRHITLKYVSPYLIYKVRRFIKRNKIDLVIDIGSMLSLISIPAILFSKCKNISWEHFNYMTGEHYFLEKFARIVSSVYSSYIVTLTRVDELQHKTNLNLRAPICTIPNFLTFNNTEPASLTSNVALAVGRLVKQKGFDNLIEIWSKFSRIDSSWILKIVGDGEDFHLLKNKIEQLNLSDRILLLPATSNIQNYYKEASVLLCTSRWEGFSMVLMEGQSFGLPIVSFDCLAGPSSIVEHNKNGLLIPDQDIDEFVNGLQKVLLNRKLLKEYGAHALISSQRFSKKTIIKKWLNLFREIKIF